MKLTKKNTYLNLISISSVAYGFVFIITDIFHYFYGIRATIEYNQSGILGFFIPYEPFEVKIYNFIVHVILIFAGFSCFKRSQITWHLYNIAFIAWIFKFPTFLFWDLTYRVNWIALTGIPYILSIIGLIYFNKENIKRKIHYPRKRNRIRITSFAIITFVILSIFSYNLGWTPSKQLTERLDWAISENKISKYKYCIRNILDTLNVNYDNIHGVGVAILDNENKPIYIEKLQIGDLDLLCYPIKYDNQGNLIQEFDPQPWYNSIIYKYDSLNRISTKKLCSNYKAPFHVNYDTITDEKNIIIFYKYKHEGNSIHEIGYRSDNDPFLEYELTKNSKGQIISRKVVNGYDDEGDIYYSYNEAGRKIKTEEYNSDGQLWKKELIYYLEGKIIRKEEFIYGRTSLSEKLLNLIKFKSYSAKNITYYFHETNPLICKK